MVLFTLMIFPCCYGPAKDKRPGLQWQPFRIIEQEGLLGERLDGWRKSRLWYMADTSWLLSGFETRPGSHAWQGEHIGKWLHAAVLTEHATGNDALEKELEAKVEKLLATQLPNGYLGTYGEDERFYNDPDAHGWDVWTHRYNLYGLLAYERYHQDEKVVDACKKMADLLIGVYGPGKHDITAYGTRKGISSTCLTESMAMLYDRTHEYKYLDFAGHIVAMGEMNPDLRLMDALLHHESVVHPGEGKAYQLMANLLGYYQLYLYTGEEDYLQATVNGWDEICQHHLLVTGGPWTRSMPYNANAECFAHPADFEPGLVRVENCCTVTWIQLNLHLFELTGLARYADEAERAFYNQLLGAQHANGLDWCYFTGPNEKARPFDRRISCCASSGPRALEMFANHQAGEMGHHLCLIGYAPARYELPVRFGGGTLAIGGRFPYPSAVEISFETIRARRFSLIFRIPSGAFLSGLEINRKHLIVEKNDKGFYQLSRQWKPGDVLRINLEYELQMHIQTGIGGRRWAAFSYGPMVMSQEINDDTGTKEPFRHRDLTEKDIHELLEMPAQPGLEARDPAIGVVDTDIELIPYYMAGSRESGPRTYFELRPLSRLSH
jgi:DUF1680 family protein